MKKTLLRNLRVGMLTGALALLFGSVMASPAHPGKVRIKQPDGTFVEVYVRGDEHSSYYESVADGSLMTYAADGWLRRVADKEAFLEQIAVRHLERKQAARAQGRQAPGAIDPVFPTTGTVNGLVILVEYPDVKFSANATQEAYEEVFNSDPYQGDLSTGSVLQYFKAQSGGLFTPHFDVVGPVCMSRPRAYYGSAESGSERVDKMFEEACVQADALGVDFSKYDCNDDGEVDFVFIVYAGYGQAQGGPEESVWPQALDLTYKVWKSFDNLYLGQGACSCELHGNEGEQLDGIGTFCHEFSHILGLPDVYDVLYTGSYGLCHWDVMDIGSYNNDSRTPAGYTAMDKYTVGWLTPMVIDKSQDNLSLKSLGENNEAYFIVSDKDQNEYFTLENRQLTGWDAALPGHGLLVSHVKYDKVVWKNNLLNTDRSSIDHIELIAADCKWSTSNEDGDTYPGVTGNTSLTPTTTPPAIWHNAASTPFSLTDIAETDGIVTFNCTMGGTSGINVPFIRATLNAGRLCVDNRQAQQVEIVNAAGQVVARSSDTTVTAQLPAGLYILKQGRHSVKFAVR